MSVANSVIQECHRAGVREYCVCAGSRNSELVRGLVAAGVQVWHFFEERCAAFFALGRVRILEAPVAVVTTSGTAAAELYPAMIEAHYQGLPLLAVTADRPRNFRGSGAPQAIEQLNLFGNYPSWQADVAKESEVQHCLSLWNRVGPAHLNVCLDEPLHEISAVKLPEVSPVQSALFQGTKLTFEPDLILLGDLLASERQEVDRFLAEWNGPVWAEASSGLRSLLGDRLIQGGDAALKHLQVTRVLRIGGVPSCRFWRDLETRPEIEVLSVSRSGHSGLARDSRVISFDNLLPINSERPFLQFQIDGLVEKFPTSECGHLRALSCRIPDGSGLFLGNSLSIREWNLAAKVGGAESNCHVMRGANGIDGNLSYFFGLGADQAESWAVVGDLTTLYDLAGPWILDQLPEAKRRIVVMNNGGGRIFRRLPSLRKMSSDEAKVIENPHELQFANWAAMWGMAYVKIDAIEQWENVLPDSNVVIEVIPDQAQSEGFWLALAEKEKAVFG